MKPITKEEFFGEMEKKTTFNDFARKELDAFLESGEEFAELDLFNYSKLYACERYLQIVRRLPRYRDSIEVICRKQHAYARRIR